MYSSSHLSQSLQSYTFMYNISSHKNSGKAVFDRDLTGVNSCYKCLSLGTMMCGTSLGAQSIRGAWSHIGRVSFCSGCAGEFSYILVNFTFLNSFVKCKS